MRGHCVPPSAHPAADPDLQQAVLHTGWHGGAAPLETRARRLPEHVVVPVTELCVVPSGRSRRADRLGTCRSTQESAERPPSGARWRNCRGQALGLTDPHPKPASGRAQMLRGRARHRPISAWAIGGLCIAWHGPRDAGNGELRKAGCSSPPRRGRLKRQPCRGHTDGLSGPFAASARLSVSGCA